MTEITMTQDELKVATPEKKNVFEELYPVNVNDKTEKKNGLTYLSWAWAWAEVAKRYPDANYYVKTWNGLPYIYDENTGYMVMTQVTINGITREMWLPVMDGSNKAMKKETYTYKVTYGNKEVEKVVQAASMFDVNKALMRCLAKNLAMFGLGLYIYAGEDLPDVEEEPRVPDERIALLSPQQKDWAVNTFKLSRIEDISSEDLDWMLKEIEKKKEEKERGTK